MNRRKFFKNGSLFTIGATILNPFETIAQIPEVSENFRNRKAKNIIFLVSDGMSQGTLTIANVYKYHKTGQNTHWIQGYKDNLLVRALMDTESASSLVTDSAAAGSAWGGGFRVKNGSLNIGANGEAYLPILQKFKMRGKKVGCVTSVPVTHATPASFSVSSKSRDNQDGIAENYLDLKFDVMMGGGANFFSAEKRKDKKDLASVFAQKGYQIFKTRQDLEKIKPNVPVLGLFGAHGMEYEIDRQNDETFNKVIPTLAEMAEKAIQQLDNKDGFVVQIEAGRVDWAAHANDIAALIHDQLAFDDAVKVALDFAQKDKNTLVIVCTDHGNANPGLMYGKDVTARFDSVQKYKKTNEWLLNQVTKNTTPNQLQELVDYANGFKLTDEEVTKILGYYNGLEKPEEGLYNYKHVPLNYYSEIQKIRNAVGWISNEHTGDYVELAMYGPGSELLKPFVKNTDLHYLMLQAAEIENKF
jgi:alkaline phosphatase